MNLQSVAMAHNKLVVFGHFKSYAASKVAGVDIAFQVMHVHRPVNLESLSMGLERDRVAHARS